MFKYFLLTTLLCKFLYAKEDLIPFNNNHLHQEIKQYKIKDLLKTDYIVYTSLTDYDPKDINVNELLSTPGKKLVTGTLYTQIFMIGTIGMLYVMPESVSNWDKNALSEKSLGERWTEHVKEGPVWDEDDFAINYIGHPVSGAWYYTMARNCGISPEGSFLYSFFLSTFIWEYGYEAFAEIPSWQDIFSTPIVGSLMGEYFYYLEKKIDKNNGTVFNSKILGSISYFLLNPIGNISNGLSNIFNIDATLRYEVYQSNYSKNYRYSYIQQEKPIVVKDQDFGFILDIKF